MIETWKTIPEYPDYKVSNYGNIINKKGLVLKPRAHPNYNGNYHSLGVVLYRDSIPRERVIARLVAEAFIKKPFNRKKNQVNHLDFDPFNNRVENLEWVTPRETLNSLLTLEDLTMWEGIKEISKKGTK